MYVRNYPAEPRKAPPRDGEEQSKAAKNPDVAPIPSSEEDNGAEAYNDYRGIGTLAERAPVTVSLNADTAPGAAIPDENGSENGQSGFGSNGIPRQPLRRRRLPRSPKEQVAPTESRSPCGQDEPQNPPEADCRRLIAEVKEDVERRRFGPFSQDDLLIGGLMLLLLSDRACDDVVLLLGILFLSGRGQQKNERRG